MLFLTGTPCCLPASSSGRRQAGQVGLLVTTTTSCQYPLGVLVPGILPRLSGQGKPVIRLWSRAAELSYELPAKMSGKELVKTGVDNTARRKWDKSEYEDKAKQRDAKEAEAEESALDAKKRKRLERDPLHQGVIVQRSHLKARKYTLNLEARLGKTQVVTPNTPLNQQAGYYCNVCDCILRDSATYLDHINGKWHQRALGMSMRVERSTAQDVKRRLEEHKSLKETAADVDTVADGFDRRVLEAEEEEERHKEERRRQRKEQRQEKRGGEEEADGGADDDMMALMGFGGFGTSSKR